LPVIAGISKLIREPSKTGFGEGFGVGVDEAIAADWEHIRSSVRTVFATFEQFIKLVNVQANILKY
jgi:hypothetical protein